MATVPNATVIDRSPLPASGPWPTIDPFLFCVHHLDAYPQSDGALGPDADLSGRLIGSDFSVLDGWSMYHGSRVPGFPQHPHRGFETVTFVRQGLVDHADSMGATARFGRGDVQWMTAGAGIVHAEMFPLVNGDTANPLEMFQIWINLPAASKMVTPHFSMMWSEDIPVVQEQKDGLPATRVTVAAGTYKGHVPPPPPPDSWAGDPATQVAIWLAEMTEHGIWDLPSADGASDLSTPETGPVRSLYLPHGSASVEIDSGADAPEVIEPGTMAVISCDRPVRVTARGTGEVLILQGTPIGEPVAQYGPFVMNTEEELQQTFADYRRTQFGGWPWASDDPNHGPDAGRFAVHADSTLDEPRSTSG